MVRALRLLALAEPLLVESHQLLDGVIVHVCPLSDRYRLTSDELVYGDAERVCQPHRHLE